jgi:hypothetical protein
MGEDFTELNNQETDGRRIYPRDILGHLILVWPVEYLPNKPTINSRPDRPSDVVVVDVVDLDVVDPETNRPGLLAQRVWWRPALLIRDLKNLIGSKNPVVAYMTQGGATPGRNAPFKLVSASGDEACMRRAREWRAQNPGFVPSAPYETDIPVPASTPAPTAAPVSPAPVQNESLLARLARSSVEGANRLPPPQPDSEPPGF